MENNGGLDILALVDLESSRNFQMYQEVNQTEEHGETLMVQGREKEKEDVLEPSKCVQSPEKKGLVATRNWLQRPDSAQEEHDSFPGG